MPLSFEKLFPLQDQEKNEWLQIELSDSHLEIQAENGFFTRLEDCWPTFSFLQGVGFERVIFRTKNRQVIEDWAYRIESYEQNYIEDPEYLHINELLWDEKDENGDSLIECLARQSHREFHRHHSLAPIIVPPMQAPLGVNPGMVKGFIEEIQSLSALDTVHRIQAILREYANAELDTQSTEWLKLLAGIVRLCLQNQLLDKAAQITQEYRKSFESIWNDRHLSQGLFECFEPKASDLENWALVFESLSNEQLVERLDKELGLPGGPQIIRLMSLRTRREPEHFVEICFQVPHSIQRILLQWLRPFWSERHYNKILKSFRSSLDKAENEEPLQDWTMALLKSYESEALSELKSYFLKKGWRQNFGFGPKRSLTRSQVLIILTALEESRSVSVFQFLKEIKSSLSGESADHVEKILQSYRSIAGR